VVRSSSLLVLTALLASCAGKPPVVVEAAPPPPVAVAAAMPAGGMPGMVIPARLSDGGWPTPARGLAGDGAVWHLRAALNVAALVCRDDAATIVPAYNALLTGHKAALAGAETRYAAAWQAKGGDWRDAYDDAMTRAYNFYGQSFARAPFCAAAATTLADLATLPDDRLTAFADERLPLLDRPFADFFDAYAAWRGDAVAAPPATGAVTIAMAIPPAKPWLGIDPAVYRMP